MQLIIAYGSVIPYSYKVIIFNIVSIILLSLIMFLRNSLKVNSFVNLLFGELLQLSHAQNLTVEKLP